jgi:hypothetical protein
METMAESQPPLEHGIGFMISQSAESRISPIDTNGSYLSEHKVAIEDADSFNPISFMKRDILLQGNTYPRGHIQSR